MANSLSLRSIFDANKLIGPNFIDWFHNIKIVSKQEKKAYVLDGPAPEEPSDDATNEEKEAYRVYMDDLDQATCVMLASMAPNLQKQHEAMDALYIILNLREMFYKESRTERFNISRELFQCKMSEGSSIRPHVLKMIRYITQLEQLGWVMDHDLSIYLVLSLLLESYSQFALNFNMNKIEVTLFGLIEYAHTG
ncbi:PREDICTED: uncharacterized protein LOC108663610 [Theobroma cacao]|uniref:Uncharacterized protein LOC108663610 n=1 Tax=Theobroma cacao TaxID=3641 RepID=A0AB32X0Q1_THECC|nr:PREDICTED: uncharacterized protein LOC108663610 [Theobroma cacao]